MTLTAEFASFSLFEGVDEATFVEVARETEAFVLVDP